MMPLLSLHYHLIDAIYRLSIELHAADFRFDTPYARRRLAGVADYLQGMSARRRATQYFRPLYPMRSCAMRAWPHQ